MNFYEFKANVEQWASDRKIYQNGKPVSQLLKAVAEMGELCDGFNKGNRAEMIDGVGDVLVCLVNFAYMQGLDLEMCMEAAWDEIKYRRGYLAESGVFVKESDNA